MYLYPCKSLKPSYTAVLKRLTQTPLNKISLTLSHQIALSPTTVTTFVLSLTSMPLSAVAHPVRGSRPWFSSIAEQFCKLKRERRKAERRWLKSRLTVHQQIYDSIKQKVTDLVDKAKKTYFSAKIESSTTCKQLFQNFNSMLGKHFSSPPPSAFDSDDLPIVFSEYFTEKIRTIRNNFPSPNPTVSSDASFTGDPLQTFDPVTDDFVLKIIKSTPAKSCELDPIPTKLLYDKSWHPLADHHQHHQHISYYWHCTTWSEDRSGELRTQKLKSHLVRTQSLNVLPFKPGVGQYIAIHATLTARDFFLAYFYPSSPFTCIFSKTSPNFFLCWPAE